jgi:hypothetical protein
VIAAASGEMRSTDCTSANDISEVDVGWPERAWGYEYLGWTGDLNGVDLPLGGGGGDDPLANYDTDKELSSGVMHGHEWAYKGEEEAQNLQEHVTQLRRDVNNINERVDKILDLLREQG